MPEQVSLKKHDIPTQDQELLSAIKKNQERMQKKFLTEMRRELK